MILLYGMYFLAHGRFAARAARDKQSMRVQIRTYCYLF